MHPVFIQAFYYGILMVLTIAGIGFIQKGFFWKYFKVRMSFGKLILVKLREINRDDFAVGKIHEGFLLFKSNKQEKRISLKDKKGFYRSLAVTWIDIDGEKNAVIETDGKAVDGFDATKYNSLYLRALYRPSLNDNREKLMMALLFCIGIGVLIAIALSWQNYSYILQIAQKVGRGVVSPGGI